MTSFESIFYWSSAVLMAGTFFLSLISMIFKRTGLFFIGHIFLLISFGALTAFGVTRWINTGHPPFVTLFESMITAVWFLLFISLLLTIFNRRFEIITLPVSLFTFLMIGWSSSLSHVSSPLSAVLTNVWLFIHASFATSGAASFLIGSSFAAIYLLGEEKLHSMEKISSRIPEHNKIPRFIFNFLILGLILWGVMIVSGSIWAHKAWGRYWGWDPIELWSLISWLLYGLLIHARLTFKIPQRVFCWMSILASLIVAFSLWGVGYIYETIHSYG